MPYWAWDLTSSVAYELATAAQPPAYATTDREVTIRQHPTQRFTVLFDPEHNLEERMLMEQFAP